MAKAQVIKIEEVKALNAEKFTNSVIELDLLKEQAKELDSRIKEIEAVIKAHMEEAGVTVLEAGGHKVTYTEVTSQRFDTTRFKEERPDDYRKFLKESTYKRFELK